MCLVKVDFRDIRQDHLSWPGPERRAFMKSEMAEYGFPRSIGICQWYTYSTHAKSTEWRGLLPSKEILCCKPHMFFATFMQNSHLVSFLFNLILMHMLEHYRQSVTTDLYLHDRGKVQTHIRASWWLEEEHAHSSGWTRRRTWCQCRWSLVSGDRLLRSSERTTRISLSLLPSPSPSLLLLRLSPVPLPSIP